MNNNAYIYKIDKSTLLSSKSTMINLRPNKTRAKYAMLMISIVMAMEILSIVSDYFQYQLLTGFLEGVETTMEEADANDTRQRIISILYIAAMIGSVITFIQWFRRAYFNLGVICPNLNHKNGWAAGAWFVPFLNLYVPYQIMKELYTKTFQYLRNNGKYTANLSTSLVGWWWALWLIGSYVSNFVARYMWKAETTETIINSTLASMFSSSIMLITGVLALMVINNYAEVEHLLEEQEPLSETTEDNFTPYA